MGSTVNRPTVGIVAYVDGYLMVASDRGTFNLSTRPFRGGLGGNPPLPDHCCCAACTMSDLQCTGAGPGALGTPYNRRL